MDVLNINTKSKQYPVIIGEGIRFKLFEILKDNIKNSYSSVFIITDSVVDPLYLPEIKKTLEGFQKVISYTVKAGEDAKSFDNYYKCLTFALENDLDRKSLIVALGGGVVGDLAGFVASTYMRGISFIQIPTTLLAHDSSVGGKVAINHPLGKNMIGAFYQPDAVIYDIEMLQSLPMKEWRSGFAEVIKHALIWDEQFFQWIKREIITLDDIQGDKLQYALKKGISIKSAVVSEDEKEQGIREYLNFGHTLAHAIEAELGYGKLSHGDAVAIGILFAVKVSEDYYQITLDSMFLEQWFSQYTYPTIPNDILPERLLKLMKKDKKAQNNKIRMVLMTEIGKVETVTLSDEYVLKRLQSFL